MRSEERAHNERLANDRYREAGRDKHPLRSLKGDKTKCDKLSYSA